MSIEHPIIAVTGSSGSGITTVQNTFIEIFRREKLNPAIVHGNSFRRYDASQVPEVFRSAADRGQPISHFGPEANWFDRLESLFREYARSGTGLARQYIESDELSQIYKLPIGTYGPWEDLFPGSDMLFYEGQHGGCIQETWTQRDMSPSHNPVIINERHKAKSRSDAGVDIARWVDLLIGVVPSINLEWIQKIHGDCHQNGCSPDSVTKTILRRLPDYVRYITPQFSLTDINFQRIPLVDTSNPFISREVPDLDESMVVIRFREPKKHNIPEIIKNLNHSFMSRPNTVVVPGGDMAHAMDIICSPIIRQLIQRKHQSQNHHEMAE